MLEHDSKLVEAVKIMESSSSTSALHSAMVACALTLRGDDLIDHALAEMVAAAVSRVLQMLASAQYERLKSAMATAVCVLHYLINKHRVHRLKTGDADDAPTAMISALGDRIFRMAGKHEDLSLKGRALLALAALEVRLR